MNWQKCSNGGIWAEFADHAQKSRKKLQRKRLHMVIRVGDRNSKVVPTGIRSGEQVSSLDLSGCKLELWPWHRERLSPFFNYFFLRLYYWKAERAKNIYTLEQILYCILDKWFLAPSVYVSLGLFVDIYCILYIIFLQNFSIKWKEHNYTDCLFIL